MADLILTFTLSAHNFVLCNKKLLIEHDTLFSINIFIFWHIAHLHHNETIRNTVVNLLLQLKHAEYLEPCIEQLAWDFCSLAFFSIVQSATWIGEAAIIITGRESTETINEGKIWKHAVSDM